MTDPDDAMEAEMAQSLGVQELQESRRSRSRVGLGPVVTVVALAVVALFLAPFLWVGTAPAVRPAPNPAPRVVTATTDWQTAAENAGYTGRLGAATPQTDMTYGDWLARYGRALAKAKAAGFTGRLGGATAPATEAGA